eukprot:2114761-Alexandrium_andersonii.AAC.1
MTGDEPRRFARSARSCGRPSTPPGRRRRAGEGQPFRRAGVHGRHRQGLAAGERRRGRQEEAHAPGQAAEQQGP